MLSAPPDIPAAGVAAGGITGATPVWREGRSSWDSLVDVPELAEVLMAAPPTRDFAGARDLKPPLSTATAASNGSTAK
jgi:hypothetical protein